MTKKKPTAPPGLFETILAPSPEYSDLPFPVNPYYVVYKNDTYLHRSTLIGTVMLKQKSESKVQKLPSTEHKEGIFKWTGDNIPGWVIAQATSFFRRIFDEQGTEAELLITMHSETRQVRLFVPYQRANGAGVKSIYDHSHLEEDWLVVGTLHSHCNFSAFHSGTDKGDAADMDGVHFTIGMLQNDPPEIVSMVTMSGHEIHFKPHEIADLDWDVATAPKWWDQYVFKGSAPSEKPKGLKTITDAEWREFCGVEVRSHVKTVVPYVSPTKTSYTPYPGPTHRWDNDLQAWLPKTTAASDDWRWEYDDSDYGLTKESLEFNRRQPWLPKPRFEQPKSPETMTVGGITWEKGPDGVYSPKTTGKEDDVIDWAINEGFDQGIITVADLDDINPYQADDIQEYQQIFIKKFSAAATILNKLGFQVNFQLNSKEN